MRQLGFVTAMASCAWVHAATHTVGPPAAGSCGGSDCDFTSIQSAIDAAAASDTITVYRRTDDATNNECYNEHITVDKALTIQGNSTTPASAVRICPSTGGDIVYITAGSVTIKNLEISGRANDGAGGENGYGAGGRTSGHGIHVYGDDIDDVHIINCSVNYTFGDNIRYYGDRDADGDGFMTVKQCYIHHSDTRRTIRILRGGGSASDRHIIRGNLVHTSQGVIVQGECNYITIEKNVIKGWPFWGHLGGNFPETRDGSHGGGWRYYSNCTASIWVTDTNPTNLIIQHNVVLGGRVGIRVNTTGTIKHNTVVNPFNCSQYDYNTTADATKIRDNTFGIMLTTGFSGTIQNNIVMVTADNRANGTGGSTTAPYYTPGITGYGIAFEGNSGTPSGATISNNNVWGFVDTDGSTALNYGSGITQGDSNLSEDPLFASDSTDESNGESAPCDADDDGTRCYELYEDNFFLSTSLGGSCHADVWSNTAGATGFVDLSNSGANDPDTDDISGLGDWVAATDAAKSRLIDFGSGATGNEPGSNGGAPNLGAYGATDRASQSSTLRVVGIDVGSGGVKDSSTSFSGPGIIQPGASGITQINVYFNRSVSASSSSFKIRNHCDTADLTAPTFDFSAATSPPYRVRMTWSADTLENQWVRIHVLGDGVDRVVDSVATSALDGEVSNLEDGTMPSGNDTAGGDAEFVVGALEGDTNGDAE